MGRETSDASNNCDVLPNFLWTCLRLAVDGDDEEVEKKMWGKQLWVDGERCSDEIMAQFLRSPRQLLSGKKNFFASVVMKLTMSRVDPSCRWFHHDESCSIFSAPAEDIRYPCCLLCTSSCPCCSSFDCVT